jgi:valyl-tRNA synthetase
MTTTTPNNNIPSIYDSKAAEAKWQKFWEENNIYKADPSKPGEPYCIVIPPPNVTGSLHMGHAFDNSIIDVLVRYHRMKGKNTLYLPGTDHASIAVQSILEKQLKEEKKTRYDIGREQFLERAWQWKAQSKGTIVGQLRRLGVSVDWTRERFTLDEGLSKAVLEAFVSLYDEGLIYRGEYLVNWCPESQSAVSDLEVDQKETNGNLWHFRYPLTDGSGYLEVATTRPETMLGDTAIAVNPDDERYKDFIGKTVTLPIMNREIPVIADDLVDPSFGTGCVKVTPAHDPNDFQMGKRHNLPFINIMNRNGTLNENAGEFQGQDRFVARKNVVARLETDGVLVKIEDYKHTVPYSERGKVPVEPLLSTQWFVKIRPMADKTLACLDKENSPNFVPQRWSKVYRDWLVKLDDWCVSRQLWWGHQIPAWYAVSETNGEITDSTPFIVAKSEADAWEKAKQQFGDGVKLERDPDVLDTWFSAGLWPFSTLGWSEKTIDLEKYYPTSVLVTGFDIIFFWVARMTMMGTHFTGQIPFEDVYIHGLVLDEKGKKMSKSLNNGIDPLLLIEKYGTDALRFYLIKEVTGAGQNIRFDYDRKKNESGSVEAARNFANKIWNGSRFVMMNLDGQTPALLGVPKVTELSDKWILSRYNRVIKQTNDYISSYGMGEAANGLYEFIWGDFCDQYIELVKSRLAEDADASSRKTAQQVLAYILEGILKLLHPYMPHITEEIWHTLTQEGDDSLASLSLQRYPEADENQINLALEEEFDLLLGTIRTIRNLRAEADVKPGVKVAINLQTDSSKERKILTTGEVYIRDLAKVESLTIVGGGNEGKAKTSTSKKEFQFSQINWRLGFKVIGGLFLLRIAIATADTLDDVPLFGQFFELVGIGYSAWFISKNLLNTPARQRFLTALSSNAEKLQHELQTEMEAPQQQEDNAIAGVVGTVQVILPLTGVVDIAAFSAKLQRKVDKIEGEINSLSARLKNSGFVSNAAPEVIQSVRDNVAEAEKQAEILRDRIRKLA